MTYELFFAIGAGFVAASATYFRLTYHAALRLRHRRLLYAYAELAGRVRRLQEDNR